MIWSILCHMTDSVRKRIHPQFLAIQENYLTLRMSETFYPTTQRKNLESWILSNTAKRTTSLTLISCSQKYYYIYKNTKIDSYNEYIHI